jgi:hypothetical protein
MTSGAIAFGGILKKPQPAPFLIRKLGFAGKIGIVFAAVGIEFGTALLIHLERVEGCLERLVRLGKHRVTENRAELAGVWGTAQRATNSAGSRLAISKADSSGMRAWSRPRSTLPSQVNPPVGPLSTLSPAASSESKKCSVNCGVACKYLSDGTARIPDCWRSFPPSCTDSELGGPNASSGLWQDAQDTLPEAESEGSRNILRPIAVSAATRP